MVDHDQGRPFGRASLLRRFLYWCTVVVLGSLAIWVVQQEVPNPHFDNAMKIREQLAALDDGDEEQRADLLYDLRKALNDLDREDRDRVMRAMRVDAQLRRQRSIDRFFNLPQDEQIAVLDRRIDEMEARRRYNEQLQSQAAVSEAAPQQPGASEDRGEAAGQEGNAKQLPGAAQQAPSTQQVSLPMEIAEPLKTEGGDGNQAAGADMPATTNSPPTQTKPAVEPPRAAGPPLPSRRSSTEYLSPEQLKRRERYFQLLDQRRAERGLPTSSSGGRP